MYTYPRPQNLAYPDRVLSGEGSLSRSDPFSGQSESWPDRGAPERSTGLAGGALGGAAPSLGRARFTLPREVGSPPASRVPIGALAPPTAPSPRAVREGFANLGRIAPRERGSLAV